MSKEESALQSERESKRSQFAEEAAGGAPKRTNNLKVLALAALALVGVAAYFVSGAGGGRVATVAGSGGAAGASGAATGDVTIPVAELDGKARFYEYKTAAGKSVRFFAVRSPDGVYRAALDACDVCFAGKQGYRQEGDDMVCNQCGMHFPSAKVNEVKGGCNPIGLQRKVEGESLTISARELEAGAGYF